MRQSKIKQQYLILIVGPSASGKTHLLKHIVKMGHKAVVSTTTRHSRPGEVHGEDYYFIDEHTSKHLEDEGMFVEMIPYNGIRYGVDEPELFSKLDAGGGVAFLIVEPKGISKYREYCSENFITPITIFVETPDDVRYARIKNDAIADPHMKTYSDSGVNRIIRSALYEQDWKSLHKWNYIVSGLDDPATNYGKIYRDVLEKLK